MRATALLLALAVAVGVLVMSTGREAGKPTLTVFAAASLSDVGPTLESAFEQEYPVDVRMSFGGSSLLATQIALGAPADVILSASAEAVRGLEMNTRVTFAANTLVIAVARTNPLKISSASLRRVKVAACAPEVPCGAVARAWLRESGIQPITWETDVKAVAGKVALGEVDAGLVYRTDVRADRRLEAIAITPPLRTRYIAGSVTDAGREFVAFMRSERVAALMSAAGFEAP